MARQLITTVHVEVDGVSQVFGPGDDLPADVQKQLEAQNADHLYFVPQEGAKKTAK